MKDKVKTSGSFVLRRFGAFDFAKAGSGKGMKIEDLDFSDEEMEMYVDLHPITNTSPYTVVETMSLAKAVVMLVLLISKTIADCFNKGVYDQIVVMKGLPFMEAHAEPYMRHLVAGDVVSGPLITFSGVEKVANIVIALRITGHNGFPVVDEPPLTETPELVGLVIRSHLLVLLKSKMFMKEPDKTSGSFVMNKFGAFDFAKAGSGKGLKIEELYFTDEEMQMYVDLHAIANTSPYTVVETMSLAKAAILFRELGLRHLLVVPKTPDRPPIVGILTRHDFVEEHIHGLFPSLNPHSFHSTSMGG
jgi:chloride channel 7